MRKVFVISITVIIIISEIFYLISHAPCKRNKSNKKAKIRKISTVVLILAMGLSFIIIHM